MKKTLALILSVLAMLIPVSALELDVAESAEVSVADEAVLAALPETTDATYGDLIYFSDFDENTNWVNTAVVGENATASYTLGYDADKAWSSNKVDDPVNSGRGKVEKLTNGSKYPYYNGIYPTFKNFALENAMLTVVWDVYVPETTTGTDPRFYFQTAAGFKKVTSASYDFEAGGWQTIVMPWPDSLITFAASQNMNTMFGFAEAGCTYYVDNFRVYAKKPAYASKPAEVDLSKGFLVYFENGNSADAYNNSNMVLVGQSGGAVVDGYYARGIWSDDVYDATSNPTGLGTKCNTHGIGVRTPDGSAFTYADGTAMNGTISAYFEMYNGMGADKGFYSWSCFNPGSWDSWAEGFTAWGSHVISGTAKNGAWTTLGAKIDASKGMIALARTAWDGHGSALDIRSAYAYYMPASRVTVDGTLVDLTGKTEYTLPAFDTADYDSYKDADGNVFVPGTYAVADINGKVLTPYLQPEYSAKPADETDDGFLVYFFNGNDSDLVKKVNIKLNKNTLKESTFVNNHYLRGFDCTLTGCATHTGHIMAEDGEGFKFTDGSAVEGDFFVVWEVYSETGTNVNDFVLCDHCTWDSWCGLETNWQGATPVKGEWTKIKRAHHADKGVTTIGIAETGWNMSSHMGEQGYGSVAVYYRPQYRVSLTDGTAKNMYDLNGETTYTIPAEYNGNAVEAWKVDGVVYLAGAEVAVADINGKTFETATAEEYYKANYAPTTDTGVEMRVTSDTSSNGIRFKASIAPSKKAEADEIGFIVAREDVLETLGAELTFDLTADGVDNAEGKLFVKGVAYDKASEKDVVYNTNEDGTEVFTGVCVGIDVTNKTQVNTVLVARPYLKMTVGGKQIAVYGAAKSASLAGVANDIKTAAEAGDEAALEAYNGAKDYIDSVISVGAGN